MQVKNKFLFLELLFTFFLLEPVIFLFGGVLSAYRPYVTLCLIAGFSFSWLNRNRQSTLAAIFINLPVLGVLAWILYLLLNSSLLYREVIIIFIKGMIILEIIFAFTSSNPIFLSYIQALSLPLLLCFPIFVKDYNKVHAVLVLIYVICWIAIFRIKFYRLFNAQPLKEEKQRRYLSIIISAIFFLIIISVSLLLFYRLLLGRVGKEGFLLEEGPGVIAEQENLEKEYYALQDKVQEEVTELIPGLSSKEARYEMLILLSALIKETPSVMETKKSHLGLISRLKTPGPGIEKAKADEIAIHTENYLDKKILFNLNNYKEKIMDSLKRNRFNAIERIFILNKINKMEGSYSNPEIKKYKRELKQVIEKSSTKSNAKRELSKQVEGFKEWKVFEAYKNKTDSLKKKLESLDMQFKKELSDLISDIDSIEKISELKKAEDRIDKLNESIPSIHKDMLKAIEEILALKVEMLISGKAKEMKEAIENLSLPMDDSLRLKDRIDDIKDAQDYQQLLKSITEYRDKSKEARVSADRKTKELLEIKTHLVFNEKEERIKDAFKESSLLDSGKELINGLEKLELEKSSEKLISNVKKLKEDIDKFSSQGLVSKASRDNMVKEIEEIRGLFQAELDAGEETGEKGTFRKTLQPDYKDEWEELIEKSSLRKERKESLKQLGKELFKAQRISQVKNIREAMDAEIEKLSKEGAKKEEIERIKRVSDSLFEIKRKLIIEKQLAGLRDKIEDLKRVNPQEAEKNQRYLEKIRDSRNNEELKNEIDAFKEYLDSKKKQEQESKTEEAKEAGDLEINILPSYLVIPVGSSVSLRAVAIYDKVFIKELGSGLDWFSSEPYVAWVDEKGVIHSLAKGEAQIHANYSGKDSQKIQVIVVERIDDEITKGLSPQLTK